MRVVPVPCLQDNYAYLLVFPDRTIVVDPSEAAPVLAATDRVDAIWCTHHHWDHIGGIEALVERFGCPVVGSRYDAEQGRIPHQTVALDDGDLHEGARIHHIPGHTLGAIAFEVGEHLFTGDTLFMGGCGRVFEGTMPMMRASLERLRGLAPELRVWCGHEYTSKNLEFALEIAPAPAVAKRLAQARAQRAAGEPTVGGTLAEERATNVFLRWDAPEVRDAAARMGADPSDPDEVFGVVRRAKDKC
jgi:hydroxyacylglutathione hydrolase